MNTTNNNTKKTLYTVAYVFAILGTIFMGFFIIPLIWCIPMTISIKKAMDQIDTPSEKPHIALGIFTLIFLSLVTGICLLVADSIQTNVKVDEVEVVE
ncbi:hypothetical protein STIUS_v1c03870 [Spiroplasma sp. TIUS-1]|uniref:hypothetical protein n=1 Tax=Spiroplasma sp. TIUS-1 TaxID=216963 RepID=UPI00139755A9|nr:hypothetical protein [Spiroplasma sp. TIUS-1]QHX35941.1 hypothetical protein STIUS_v1c03870 [Spiroplasma sp. TIUS-1]